MSKRLDFACYWFDNACYRDDAIGIFAEVDMITYLKSKIK